MEVKTSRRAFGSPTNVSFPQSYKVELNIYSNQLHRMDLWILDYDISFFYFHLDPIKDPLTYKILNSALSKSFHDDLTILNT